MALSAVDAALEGFRLAREKPAGIAALAVANLVFFVATTVLMVVVLGHDMAALETFGASRSPDPAKSMEVLRQAGKLYLVMIPIALIQWSLFLCAIYRMVLRPEDKGLFYFKLGGDELRMMGLTVILGLLGSVLFLVVAIVAVIVSGIVAAIIAGRDPAAMAAMVVVGYVVAIGVFVWLGVRMSLAGAMTFAEGRLMIFDSWRATKGKFWTLFGCYLLAWILGVIVSLCLFLIFLALSAALGEGPLAFVTRMSKPDYSSFAAFLSPVMMLYVLFSSVIGSLYYAITLSPAALAYQQMVQRGIELEF